MGDPWNTYSVPGSLTSPPGVEERIRSLETGLARSLLNREDSRSRPGLSAVGRGISLQMAEAEIKSTYPARRGRGRRSRKTRTGQKECISMT